MGRGKGGDGSGHVRISSWFCNLRAPRERPGDCFERESPFGNGKREREVHEVREKSDLHTWGGSPGV